MNRKVVLGQYDPRRVSSVLVPIQPPPTADLVAPKISRFTGLHSVLGFLLLTAPSVFLYYLFSQNNDIPLPNNYYVSELNKSQENNTDSILAF
jgi:hypothetical protein